MVKDFKKNSEMKHWQCLDWQQEREEEVKHDGKWEQLRMEKVGWGETKGCDLSNQKKRKRLKWEEINWEKKIKKIFKESFVRTQFESGLNWGKIGKKRELKDKTIKVKEFSIKEEKINAKRNSEIQWCIKKMKKNEK